MGCFGLRGGYSMLHNNASGPISGPEQLLRNTGYHLVFSVSPWDFETRKLIAKIEFPKGRRASYMHSLAATPNFIVLAADPLYLNISALMRGTPLGRGGLETNGDPTIFQIIDRRTGQVRTHEAAGFIYGHMINSWEEGDEILIDFMWYEGEQCDDAGMDEPVVYGLHVGRPCPR